MKLIRSMLAFSLVVMAACSPQKDPTTYRVYIGTYTAPNGSRGVYRFDLDPTTGHATTPALAAVTPNPSFLAIHPDGRRLYACGEVMEYQGQKTGSVTAFAIDPVTGDLTKLNAQSSRGAAPCHLVVDPTGRNVLVANYVGGNVAALPIAADGTLGEPTGFAQHEGPSKVNPQRQEAVHAHSINVSPDGRYALAADLGADKVFIYAFDPKAGTLTPRGAGIAPSGGGPRHLAFHPNGKFAYANNELTSSVTAYTWDAKRYAMNAVQSLSTLPVETPNNTTAEVVVHPSGRFLYVSNRVHDTLAAFRIDPATGRLTPIGHTPTGGKIPRNFAIDPTGQWLLAANQDSDTVTIFRVHQETGALTPTGQSLQVPKPVCIRFLPLD